jgi:hypothetical protein
MIYCCDNIHYVALSSDKQRTIYIYITTCGRGGTADALASGASGGNPVVVQIHSTAPSISKNLCESLSSKR